MQERENVSGKKGITGSTLKIIALATMLTDHIGAVVLGRMELTGALLYAYYIMRIIGRTAFPIFCFLLAEGFRHTGSKTRYALRMLVFALVSEIPFDLAVRGEAFDFSYQNVFFTLFIGLLVLCGLKKVSSEWKPDNMKILAAFGLLGFGYYCGAVMINFACSFLASFGAAAGIIAELAGYMNALPHFILGVLIAAVCGIVIFTNSQRDKERFITAAASLFFVITGMLAADWLRTDYAGFGVLAAAVIYLFGNNPETGMAAGCITLTVNNVLEVFSFVDVLLVHRYNGQRGLRLKYVFYVFYPAHLLLLYYIAKLIA